MVRYSDRPIFRGIDFPRVRKSDRAKSQLNQKHALTTVNFLVLSKTIPFCCVTFEFNIKVVSEFRSCWNTDLC